MKIKKLEVIFHPSISRYEVNGSVVMDTTIMNFIRPGMFLFETEKEAKNFMEDEIAKN